MSSKTQLIPLVTSSIPNIEPNGILDCACGLGKWASIIRCHAPKMLHAYIVGVDVFLPNIRFCKKYGAYDDLVLGDVRKLPFKSNCISIMLACEVIEHMEKNDGINFLDELERVSSGRIIVTTPNGSWPENPVVYEDGTKNIYEQHKSEWKVKDFRRRGYEVRGIGIKLKLKGGRLQQIVAGLDFLLFPAWFLPQIGKHLVAYKDTS